MPMIVVWNAREKIEAHSVTLRTMLRNACLNIKTLRLTENDVTVVFAGVNDQFSSEGGPLIIMVEILFDKPGRTLKVRKELAKELWLAAHRFYDVQRQPGRKVEVAVKRFNPKKDAFFAG